MRTIEEIKAKCDILPHSEGSKKEHWIWNGGTVASGKGEPLPVCRAPNYTKDPTGKTMTSQPVARAIKHIRDGKPIRSQMMGFRFCSDPMCISPDCTTWTYRNLAGKKARKIGRHAKSTEKRRVARAAAWQRAREKPITPEMVSIMRSQRPVKELANELGVPVHTVKHYRSARAYRSAPDPFRGLFSGLLRP